MSSDLAPLRSLVNLSTGEVIDLATATREDLAGWYVAVMEARGKLEQMVRVAEHRFAELSDKETELGVHVDGWRVSVPGAAERFVPDAAALRAALLGLVAEGALSQTAADDACRPNGVECPHCGGFVETGGFKVSQKALNALRKVKRHETIIDACGEYHAPSRFFQVKRA